MSGQRHTAKATKWPTGLVLVLAVSGALLVGAGCVDLDSSTPSLTSTTVDNGTTTTEALAAASGSDGTSAPSTGDGHEADPADGDDPGPADPADDSSGDSPFTPMSFVGGPIEYLFDEDDNGQRKTIRMIDSFDVRLRFTVADGVADYTSDIIDPAVIRCTGDGLTRDPATMLYTQIIENYETVEAGMSGVVILLRHEDGTAFRVWQISVEVVE